MSTDNRANEPTPEQIERAAATIAVEDLILWRKTWGDLSEGTKQDFRSIARAALVAAQGDAPAHPVIDREALIHAIAARHWDEDSGEVENWDGLTTSEKQNVIDNYLCPRVADSVIAHLSAAPQAETDRALEIAHELANVHTFTMADGEAIARAALSLAAPVPSSGVDEDKLAEVICLALNHRDGGEECEGDYRVASAVAEWLKGQGGESRGDC